MPDAAGVPGLIPELDAALSAELGTRWHTGRVTDLGDRASHLALLLHGDGRAVFVKGSPDPDAADQFHEELRSLDLVRRLAGVPTPHPIGSGVFRLSQATVLVMEAVRETAPERRTEADWRAIGRLLALMHRVKAREFGLEFDCHFGPLPQNNRAIPGAGWAEFFRTRRILPRLSAAWASGNLPAGVAARVERLAGRLSDLVGAEPVPSLLHGDAQQNNFLSAATGAVIIDPAPFFGHPEYDLAMVDIYAPVSPAVFAGYQELLPLDPGFWDRRTLWRLPTYLAVAEVDGGHTEFGRRMLQCLDRAITQWT